MIVQSREGRRNTTEVGEKGGGGGDGWEGRRSRSEGNGEERKKKKAFKTTEYVCVCSHQRHWCCGILVISSILNLLQAFAKIQFCVVGIYMYFL